jgi:hypothetical protein
LPWNVLFQQVKLGILSEVKIAQKRGNHNWGNGKMIDMGIVKIHTKVLPGNRIELTSPELPEGQEVEVVVRPSNTGGNTIDYSDPRELLKLPVEQRRPYLRAAAERMLEYYSQPDHERDEWQGGDIVEY